MGLFGVPGAFHPERGDLFHEALHLDGDGGRHLRDVHTRQVVGLDLVTQGVPVDCTDQLIVGTQAPQHGHRHRWSIRHRRHHVGQDRLGVYLGDEQRPTLPRRLNSEAVGIDDANTICQGIYAEAGPCQVCEREGRQDDGVNPVVGDEHLNGPLGDHRRARDRIQNGPGLVGRSDHLVDDSPVDLVERCRFFVVVVEGGDVSHEGDGWMPGCPGEANSAGCDRLQRAGRGKVASGWAETNDGYRRRHDRSGTSADPIRGCRAGWRYDPSDSVVPRAVPGVD